MTAPALSPEYQLSVDWEEVAALADHHRLAPLVWRMC